MKDCERKEAAWSRRAASSFASRFADCIHLEIRCVRCRSMHQRSDQLINARNPTIESLGPGACRIVSLYR